MVCRWVAAGMLNAERSFRRVKGCKEMPKLVEALRRHVDAAVTPSWDNERAAQKAAGRSPNSTTFGTSSSLHVRAGGHDSRA
jgi:hypothetical protein